MQSAPPGCGIVAYAKIHSIIGFATSIDINGRVRQLTANSVLLFGEQIETGTAKLELMFPDGHIVMIGPRASVTFDLDLLLS